MRPIFIVATLLLLAVPVDADHCRTWTTSTPEVDLDLTAHGEGHYYVDNDLCQMCVYSLWIYEESNGIPGLQRGDEYHDDTCHGMILSDTIHL